MPWRHNSHGRRTLRGPPHLSWSFADNWSTGNYERNERDHVTFIPSHSHQLLTWAHIPSTLLLCRMKILTTSNHLCRKGPPWLPLVNGSTRCNVSTACSTFNEADALYIRSLGWSVIRLGVIWAGGQPTPEPKLDTAWVERLQAILALCETHGIRVLLDVHQDAVGTAMCGEGMISAPWFAAL